jgi:hypothetical protein
MTVKTLHFDVSVNSHNMDAKGVTFRAQNPPNRTTLTSSAESEYLLKLQHTLYDFLDVLQAISSLPTLAFISFFQVRHDLKIPTTTLINIKLHATVHK